MAGWLAVILQADQIPDQNLLNRILDVVRHWQPKSTFLSSMKQLPNQFDQSLRLTFTKWIFCRCHPHYGWAKPKCQKDVFSASSPHFHGQSLSAPHCHSQVFEEIVIRQCLAFRYTYLGIYSFAKFVFTLYRWKKNNKKDIGRIFLLSFLMYRNCEVLSIT